MKITQGMFSFLPELTDEQISKQIQYALDHGWAISLEWTHDPHPRNSYWELHALPMFDIKDAASVMGEVAKARAAHAECYVKLTAYDARLGRQTTAMDFIIQRPSVEPGFRLDRTTGKDRQISYSLHSYALDESKE